MPCNKIAYSKYLSACLNFFEKNVKFREISKFIYYFALLISSMGLDKLDFDILNYLVEKEKQQYKTMAKELETTLPTIYNRIDKLKKTGVLKGIYPALNLEKLGYDITVFLQIDVDSSKRIDLANELKQHKNIIGVFEVSGSFSMLVMGKYKSMQNIYETVKQFSKNDKVREIEIVVAYNTFKETVNPFPLTED